MSGSWAISKTCTAGGLPTLLSMLSQAIYPKEYSSQRAWKPPELYGFPSTALALRVPSGAAVQAMSGCTGRRGRHTGHTVCSARCRCSHVPYPGILDTVANTRQAHRRHASTPLTIPLRLFRYAVRGDSDNKQLRLGVVAAFGLVRASGAADVLQATAADGPLSLAVVGPAALYALESLIVFGFASAAVEVGARPAANTGAACLAESLSAVVKLVGRGSAARFATLLCGGLGRSRTGVTACAPV